MHDQHHRPTLLTLVSLLSLWLLQSSASPAFLSIDLSSWVQDLPGISGLSGFKPPQRHQKRNDYETNPNGSTFLWMIQDTFQGQSFFDKWTFYTGQDPTNGWVHFLNSTEAFSSGLAYVDNSGKAIMHGDNTTWLANGVNRSSVRISSWAQYNGGLFILDTDTIPWGCGVWPAWWTLGGGYWPYTGEIDIIEGVHDNEHNQVAWHTAPNCTMNPSVNITGTIKTLGDGTLNTDCNGLINDNSGCGVTETSRASYGPTFDAGGGGVYAMKWDENGIAVWSFYRSAVPQDITAGTPAPSGWGNPVAMLSPSDCGPLSTYFVNHSIVFDITFCGDWAGNSYATSGCPGTCLDRLMDPSNFDNATWTINSLKVYRKQALYGPTSSAAHHALTSAIQVVTISVIFAIALIL